MRRLLVLAALAGGLAASAPAHATPSCTQLTSDAGVCVQVLDCYAGAEGCVLKPIVDPYCSDHYQTIWCRTVDGLYVYVPPMQ